MKMIFKGKRFRLTSGFETPDRPDHHGVDLVGLDSDIVISPVEGTVMVSTIVTDKSNLTWEWGNYVRVDDRDGNRYHFCHLAKRLAVVGQKVTVGTELGIMGDTGYSFGKHTHFEIRKADNRTRIDPTAFLGVPNIPGEYSVEPDGWVKLSGNRWQYRKGGNVLKSQWLHDSDGYWYYLGADGYMVTGLQKIGGKLYFLNPQRKHDIPTGACIITDDSGAIK